MRKAGRRIIRRGAGASMTAKITDLEGRLSAALARADKKPVLKMGLCRCGHAGGPNPEGLSFKTKHRPRFGVGHGSCAVIGCSCRQYTWVGWVGRTKAAINKALGV